MYIPEFRATGAAAGSVRGETGFANALALAEEVLHALGRDAILVGHGIGGLIALKLAERTRVRAGVALAPLVPGFWSPLFSRARNLMARWRGGRLWPPSGRVLFEFVADADPVPAATTDRGVGAG